MIRRILSVIHWALLIAAASIGIEAYNRHPEYKATNKGGFDFLWWMIAFGIVGIIFQVGMIFMFGGYV
jgi:hypothetical protein